MQADDPRPEWVICHQVTRTAAGPLVRCPQRGPVLSEDCLGCRFLMTSSVERTAGPWCEVAPAGAAWAPAVPILQSAGDEPALPVGVRVLPTRRVAFAVTPAVRPPEAVPSGQPIGT